MKKVLSILFVLLSFQNFAQKTKSVVCDAVSKTPLPQANIKIKGTKNGTLANNEGVFSLASNQGKIIVSYIGYFSKEIDLKSLPDTVFLQENNLLNEIVVMPDSSLKVLLKNAFNSISKNYPQKPSYLTGFYREINQNLDSNRFNYFSESVFKVYKPAYTGKGADETGQIQRLKSRNVQHPVYEKSNIQFSGGPFIALGLDRVLKQNEFLNPKSFKKFHYQLEKIVANNDQPTFVVAFMKKDSTTSGKLFIDKNTKAYIKIETFQIKPKKSILYTTQNSKTTSVYEKDNESWGLKYAIIDVDFKIPKQNVNVKAEYVTLSTDLDSVKAFKYDEQFGRNEIIVKQNTNLSDDFFKEYNGVLQQTQALKEQVDVAFRTNEIDSLKTSLEQNKNYNTIKNKENKKPNFIEKFFENLDFKYGFEYAPLSGLQQNVAGSFQNVFTNPKNFEQNIKSKNTPILFNVIFRYNINKHLSASYTNGNSMDLFSQPKLNYHDFGLAYKWVLNSHKKPIFIIPSIKYSNIKYGIDMGKFENPDRKLVLEGEKLNAKFLRSGLYAQSQGIKLGLTTSIIKLGRRKLWLGVDYLIPLNEDDYNFELIENSAFFQRKRKVEMPLNDSRLKFNTLNTNQLPKINGNFWVNLSYKREF